ncbi:MAG: glycosyltransferase family 9 protein [Candidatus Omnitrophica bacterium]|nr:glycosyltransferase family 9 protein [Candidatus Omnitrophota bacterium]
MQKTGKKICIIKLDGMGDVLRTTPILWCFQGDDVTWITERTSLSLLNNNPFIKTIIPISEALDIKDFVFDELYNFDEDKKACFLAMNIRAKEKKGYGLKDSSYFPFDSDSRYAYELSKNDELKFKLNKKTYQQIIFEMAGFQWNGEDYILGYKPKSKIQYTVGINYLVGDKFPNKVWPHGKELVDMLDSVSLQRQFESVEEYIEWINSCRIFVTGDSLGMHIALALRKKVIILMGSTSLVEIETYNQGIILTSQLPCSPCYKKNKCNVIPSCMDLITPERVYSEIMKMEEVGYQGGQRWKYR